MSPRFFTLISIISSLAYSKCPLNGYEYKGKCYIYIPMVTSWDVAENYCQLQGGHLPSIHSLQDNNFLLSTVMNVTNPVDSENYYSFVFIGAQLINGSWRWTNGSPYDFDYFDDTQDNPYCCAGSRKPSKVRKTTNLAKNKPYCCGTVGNLVLTSPEDMVPYIQGHWISSVINYHFSGFICELPLCDSNGQSAPSLISPNATNGTGIIYLQISDSYFLSAASADEIYGEEICQTMAAHLPSVHNAFENTELVNAMSTYGKGVFFYFDFGLRSDNYGVDWYYTDGSNVTYTNWGTVSNTSQRLYSYIQPYTGNWFSEAFDPIWSSHHLGCQLKRNINLCQ